MNPPQRRERWVRWLPAALLAAGVGGCAFAPAAEVAVESRLGPGTQVSEVRWHDCRWDAPLADGQRTSAARCLPGASPVRFDLLDPRFFEQGEPGPIRPIAYRTRDEVAVDGGRGIRVVVLEPDAVVPDWDDPGRAGH